MKEVVDVNTGEVKIGRKKTILRSIAIGSCIVIAAYDFRKSDFCRKTGKCVPLAQPPLQTLVLFKLVKELRKEKQVEKFLLIEFITNY